MCVFKLATAWINPGSFLEVVVLCVPPKAEKEGLDQAYPVGFMPKAGLEFIAPQFLVCATTHGTKLSLPSVFEIP